MMCEQHDTTLREVLAQVAPVDLVRLLTWFFSTTDNPGAAPTHSKGGVLATAIQPRAEAFVDNTTPGLESFHAPLFVASPVSTSNPVLWTLTLPPLALSMSTIEASSTPGWFSSLMLIVGSKPKKHDYFSNSVSDDQCDKRAHIRIKVEPINNGGAGSAPPVARCDTAPIEGGGEWEPLINSGDAESDRHHPAPKHSNISSGCSLPDVQPESSSGVQPQPAAAKQCQQLATALTSLSSSSSMLPPVQPRMMLTLMMLWLWRTLGVWEIKIDSVMGVSEDDTDQDDDESNSEIDSQEDHIGTPAPLQWVGWWSVPTCYCRWR